MLTCGNCDFWIWKTCKYSCVHTHIYLCVCVGITIWELRFQKLFIGEAFCKFLRNLVLYCLMDNSTRTSCRGRSWGFHRFYTWFLFPFCVQDKPCLCEFCIWCKIHTVTLSASIPERSRITKLYGWCSLVNYDDI